MRINNYIGQNYWNAMPRKVDMIDKKIMYLLCRNARFSNTAIAKALGLTREVVSYRIKKMQETGFLNGFLCQINPRKLGFLTHFIYLKLKTPTNEKEFVNELLKLNEITNLKNQSGRFDLRIQTTTKSLDEFDALLKKILNQYHNTVQEYHVLNLLDDDYLGLELLLEPESIKKLSEFNEVKGSTFHKDFSKQSKKSEVITLSELDQKIISVIKMNSRASLKEIAAATKSNFPMVKQRISKLITNGVILRFRSIPTLAHLGYQMYPVLFNMHHIDDTKFITFIRQHPNISWYYKFVGNWNYQVNIVAKSNAEFHNVLNDIREEFQENINSFDVMMVFNSFKSEHRIE